MRKWPEKDPDDVVDYSFDWSDRLRPEELISTSTFIVEDGSVSIDSSSVDGAVATAWISGGVDGETVVITNRIRTTRRRIYDRAVRMKIRQSSKKPGGTPQATLAVGAGVSQGLIIALAAGAAIVAVAGVVLSQGAAVAATGDTTSSAAGSASGSGAASGVSVQLGYGAGSASGAGAATGAGVPLAEGSATGVASGAGAATAAGASVAGAAGTGIGTGNAVGQPAHTQEGTGAASGAGAAQGSGSEIGDELAAGVAAGSSIALAAGRATGAGAGTASGLAGAAGVSNQAGSAAGSALGVGNAAATSHVIRFGAGASSGAGAAVASAISTRAGAGAAAGTGIVAGVGLVVGDQAPTSLVSSVTIRNTTITLDRQVLVCYDAVGVPVFISDRVFKINSITPVATTLNGYVINGTMPDPYLANDAPQGFSGYLGVSGGSSQNAARTTYSAAQNVDPGVSGPINIAIGDAKSFVKSLHNMNITAPATGTWRHFDDLVVFHVLPTVPPAGFFAPSPSAIDKSIKFTTGMRQKGGLGLGFAYPSGQSTLAACVSSKYFARPFQAYFGTSGECRRRMIIADFNLSLNGYSGGTGGFGLKWSDFVSALLAEGSDVDDTQLNMALAFGIHLYGLAERGDDFAQGAGQHCGHKQFLHLLLHIFPDVPGIEALVHSCLGNATDMYFWADAADIGIVTGWPGVVGSNHNYNRHTYEQEDVGRPYWITDERPDAEVAADYEFTSGACTASELLNIMLLKNGPGGKDGTQVLLRDGAFDETNPYAARIAYLDRYMTLNTSPHANIIPYFSRQKNYYNARRDTCAVPRWSGTPDAFSPVYSQTSFFTTSSNSISWDFNVVGGFTEPVTRMDVFLSLDAGISFKNFPSVTYPTGTITSLPAGVPIYTQTQRHSASGAGPRSVNYKRQTNPDTGLRAVLTPLGTPSGTPACTQNPQIMKRKYPNWAGPIYEAAGASVARNTELFGGVGWWTGDLTGGFTRVWKLNGTQVSTAASYTPASAGTLTLTVSCGSTTATVATVTVT